MTNPVSDEVRDNQGEIEEYIKRQAQRAEKTLTPTKKWIAGLVGGLLLIVVHGVASEGFDTTEAGELAVLLATLVPAFFRSNDPTPGGVPTKPVA